MNDSKANEAAAEPPLDCNVGRLKDTALERKRELERRGDFLPPCDYCNDGAYCTFPFNCPCGRK